MGGGWGCQVGRGECIAHPYGFVGRDVRPAIYCNCNRAWLKRYFESIFERPVEVKMGKTIIEGAKSCEYTIYLK